MYEKHEMEVLDFDSQDVFAAIGDEASDEGSGSYSWKPDRSDS